MRRSIGLAALALTLTASAAAPAQSATATADAAVSAWSAAPVPGAFTAGQVKIVNRGGAPLPAGSTFIVQFRENDGTVVNGTTTLTRAGSASSGTTITTLSKGVYRITLTRPMAAWSNADFIWSDAHWFAPAERDSVSIRVESLGGVVDPNTDNNLAVYNNNGKGF